MLKIKILLFFIMLALNVNIQSNETNYKKLDELISKGHLFIDKIIDNSEETKLLDYLNKKFGEPIEKEIKLEKNRHIPDKNNEFLNLHYDGLIITMLNAPDGIREFIFRIEITNSKYKVLYDLNINENIKKVLDTLGEPTESKENYILYEGNLSYIVFYYDDNKIINKIIWRYYFD